jgi:cytosine/adenosine deaminase-related metal-dependent hydrolase
MTQATLTQERTEEKALSALVGEIAQGQVTATATGMVFYTPQRKSVKELWEAAREATKMAVPTIRCGLCGQEASVLSQEFYRSGRQVCAECFDAGWRDWLKERRRARGR